MSIATISKGLSKRWWASHGGSGSGDGALGSNGGGWAGGGRRMAAGWGIISGSILWLPILGVGAPQRLLLRPRVYRDQATPVAEDPMDSAVHSLFERNLAALGSRSASAAAQIRAGAPRTDVAWITAPDG